MIDLNRFQIIFEFYVCLILESNAKKMLFENLTFIVINAVTII